MGILSRHYLAVTLSLLILSVPLAAARPSSRPGTDAHARSLTTPLLYRIGNTGLGQVVEASPDGGARWSVILSPITPHPATASTATLCPLRAYQTLGVLATDGVHPSTLYIATTGTPGNYLDQGCSSAQGGLYIARNAQPATALPTHGLPYAQDPVGRTIRAYSIDAIIAAPGPPETLYVHASQGSGPGSPPAGYYRTIDGGQHWLSANNGLQPSQTITNAGGIAVPVYNRGTLTVSPANPLHLALTNDTGQYTSRNGGASWQMATSNATTTPPAPFPSTTTPTALPTPTPASLRSVTRPSLGASLPQGWAWQAITQTTTPPARQDNAAAWDPIDQALLVFGGTNTAASTAMGDLWSYSTIAATWTADASGPPSRFGVGGTWDPVDNGFLIFGGQTGGGTPTFFSDVWLYTPGTGAWTQLWMSNAANGPSPRSHAVVTWDSADNRLLVFGGQTGGSTQTATNDLWAFTIATRSWTALFANNTGCAVTCPQPRTSAEGTWDAAQGQLVLFGGYDQAGAILSDSWLWTPTGAASGAWLSQDMAAQPAGRADGTIAFASAYSTTVVGPGLSLATGNQNDAWAGQFAQATWQQLPIATGSAPPVRRLAQWVWDTTHQRFLLFGGRVAGVGADNDLWQLAPSSPVAMPTPAPTSTTLKGIDIGRTVDSNGGLLLSGAQIMSTSQAMASYVRLNFVLGLAPDWAGTTPTSTAMLAAYDSVVNSEIAAGVQVVGLVTAEATHDGNQADWTANNVENGGTNGNNSFLSQTYVQGALVPLIAHFHDRIKTWEIWNEPNTYQSCSRTVCSGGSFIYPSNFAALLADAYSAIKAPSPTGLGRTDVALISGGLFGHSIGGALTATNAGATYLSNTITQGTTTGLWTAITATTGHFPLDGVGEHLYIDQNLLTTATDISTYEAWIHSAAAVAGMPSATYLTESGWATTAVPQETQARNLNVLYTASRAVGYVAQATWFDLHDIPSAVPPLSYGLIDATGQAKLAFNQYAAQPLFPTPTATSIPSPTPTATSTPSPTPTGSSGIISLTIQAGWTLITLPLSPTTPLMAATVLQTLLASGGGSLAELAAWTGTGWAVTLDSAGSVQGSFALTPNQGYFIYSDRPTTITMTGTAITGTPHGTLQAGWNLIGIPTATGSLTARAFLQQLAAAGLNPLEIAGWTGTQWQVSLTGAGQTDFAITPTNGYFVYVQNGGPF